MKLVFSSHAWEDYMFWQQNDQDMLVRVNELLTECMRHPFKGRGKPEPLKGDLSGWWSRRLTREHRIVYRMTGTGASQALEVAQLRFHY